MVPKTPPRHPAPRLCGPAESIYSRRPGSLQTPANAMFPCYVLRQGQDTLTASLLVLSLPREAGRVVSYGLPVLRQLQLSACPTPTGHN